MRTLFALAAFVALAAGAPAQEAVGYDEYAQLPRQEQVRVFGEMTPEARAAIVQTHVGRWLAVNRERLSAEQVAVVEETMAWVGPRLYDEEDREAEQAELLERMGRLEAVLSREDIGRAFGEPGSNGNYIPPPDGE